MPTITHLCVYKITHCVKNCTPTPWSSIKCKCAPFGNREPLDSGGFVQRFLRATQPWGLPLNLRGPYAIEITEISRFGTPRLPVEPRSLKYNLTWSRTFTFIGISQYATMSNSTLSISIGSSFKFLSVCDPLEFLDVSLTFLALWIFFICLFIQGVFFHWYPPKKLKYGKPRLGGSTLT